MHSQVPSFPPLRTKWLGQNSTTELIIQFILESTFLVFINSKLLSFFFSSIRNSLNISLCMNKLVMNKLVLMLYYTVFYEMTHRPSILEFYIYRYSFSLFLSFFRLSIPFFCNFALKKFKLKFNFFSCYKDMTAFNISWLVL